MTTPWHDAHSDTTPDEFWQNPKVLDAKQEFQRAQATFNRAYFEYKNAEADLMYIRDATALLREM